MKKPVSLKGDITQAILSFMSQELQQESIEILNLKAFALTL